MALNPDVQGHATPRGERADMIVFVTIVGCAVFAAALTGSRYGLVMGALVGMPLGIALRRRIRHGNDHTVR